MHPANSIFLVVALRISAYILPSPQHVEGGIAPCDVKREDLATTWVPLLPPPLAHPPTPGAGIATWLTYTYITNPTGQCDTFPTSTSPCTLKKLRGGTSEAPPE